MAMENPSAERSRPCAHGETAETCPLPGFARCFISLLGPWRNRCCRLRPRTDLRLRQILSEVSKWTKPEHNVGPALPVRMLQIP